MPVTLSRAAQTSSGPARLTAPGSLGSAWDIVIAAGGLDDADAAAITDPATQIDAESAGDHYDLQPAAGEGLLLAMAYPAAVTAITTQLQVNVFGFDGAYWHRLKDAAGNTAITLTAAPSTDVQSTVGGVTHKVTQPVVIPDAHASRTLRFGVIVALAGTTPIGNEPAAMLLAKVI